MFRSAFDFFQTQPLPVDQYIGNYDIRLVILSYCVFLPEKNTDSRNI